MDQSGIFPLARTAAAGIPPVPSPALVIKASWVCQAENRCWQWEATFLQVWVDISSASNTNAPDPKTSPSNPRDATIVLQLTMATLLTFSIALH